MDVNPDAAIAVGYLKKGGLPARFLNWIFGQTLRHSDDIVVLDRWMKERIVGHGADPDRVSIVPPWPVDEFAQIDARTAGTKFRQELRIDGKFVVLYSGNHSVVHPLDTLMEAAVQLKDDPSVQFLFIGGGLRVAEVTECVKRHELKHVLQIAHQPRERLAESLFSADLHVVVMGEAVSGLVHTSKIYGILSTGIPYVFIGPRRSHVVDLLQECPYGFHVEHGNASGLVQAIRKAQALKPAERAVYSRENRQFVTSRYSARKSMSLFAEEVLGHPARQTDPVLRSSHG
jgi:glycosyltransferase involved in cell wall biosynthesis